MYFHSKDQLEVMAEGINQEYYPERLDSLLPLDPYDLLEKMGLEIEWKFISPNESLLGMIFFGDSVFPIWENGNYQKGDKPHFEHFKKGTIVINEVLTKNKKSKGREVFACTHEITHWIKDKEYFNDHPNELVQICDKKSITKTYWNSQMSDTKKIERQNNYLCAAVLMPKEAFKKAFFRALRYKNIPKEPIEYMAYMKEQIANIAKHLNINFNPVLYRLYDLEILKRPEKEEFIDD